jgi:hypothetical protein
MTDLYMVFNQFKDVCALHMNKFKPSFKEINPAEFLKEIVT